MFIRHQHIDKPTALWSKQDPHVRLLSRRFATCPGDEESAVRRWPTIFFSLHLSRARKNELATNPPRPASSGHVTRRAFEDPRAPVNVFIDLFGLEFRSLRPDLVLLFTSEGKADRVAQDRVR
jgi:hypothetical protein